MSDDDRTAWEAGSITQADIAGRLGVSAPAVCKEMRRRGWKKPQLALPSQSSPDPSTVLTLGAFGPAASAPALTSEDIEAALSDTALGLLGLLHRETARLISDPAALVGASGLKALAAALTSVRSDLQAAGVIRPTDETIKPITLTVRVLTPEEELEIRRSVEAESPQDDDPAVLADGCDRAASAPESRMASRTNCTPFIPGPLPPREGFPAWLRMVGRRYGAATLRRVVRELTGDEAPMLGLGIDDLIDQIVSACSGDPNLLRPFAD